MVASDTVVGVVGAVLLVAVMVGVFAYEYNHADHEGTDGNGGHGDFGAAYAHLDGSQDIDGDGITNANDSDIDGDHVANADDTVIAVTVAIDGSSPPTPVLPGGLPVPGGPTGKIYESKPFMVGTGAVRLNGSVSYDVAAPSPIPPSPSISFALVADNGVSTPADCLQGGTTVICTFDLRDLTLGNYTVQGFEESPGPAVTFAGDLVIVYASSPVAEATK